MSINLDNQDLYIFKLSQGHQFIYLSKEEAQLYQDRIKNVSANSIFEIHLVSSLNTSQINFFTRGDTTILEKINKELNKCEISQKLQDEHKESINQQAHAKKVQIFQGLTIIDKLYWFNDIQKIPMTDILSHSFTSKEAMEKLSILQEGDFVEVGDYRATGLWYFDGEFLVKTTGEYGYFLPACAWRMVLKHGIEYFVPNVVDIDAQFILLPETSVVEVDGKILPHSDEHALALVLSDEDEDGLDAKTTIDGQVYNRGYCPLY